MIRFPAVDCALEGFRLTRERPQAVAVWSVLILASGLVTSAIMVGSGLQGAMQTMQSASQSGDMAAVNAQAAVMGARAPAIALFFIVGAALNVVLYTALLRAVLRPQAQGRSFYLRVGRDEARQLALSALIFVLVVAAAIVAFLAAGLVGALVLAAAPGAAASVRVLMFAVVAGALTYPVIRLSLAAPMTFDGGKVVLFGSWQATKDQFWGVFGAYVLAVVMAFLVWLLFMIVVGAVLLATLMLAGQGLGQLQGWLSADLTSLSALFGVRSLTAFVLTSIMNTLVYVITMSPAPAIYRALGAAAPAPAPR